MIGNAIDQPSLSKNGFSSSRAYFFGADETWCVRRAKQIPFWKNVYYIASYEIVLLGIALQILCFFMAYGLSSFEDHPWDIWTSVLICYQALLLIPSPIKLTRGRNRCFFGASLLTLLATTTTFLAFYYKFMLQPRYENQIATFDQIVGKRFLLAGTTKTKDYLMQQNLVNRKTCGLNRIDISIIDHRSCFFVSIMTDY